MTTWILRKVCASCEKIAEEHPRNEFGNLGGWINTAVGWFCPDCPVKR